MCNGPLDQYLGLGSETRRTSTWVPNPYGIEIGDPKTIPNGYEERWVLDIHAIDTRGVKDRLGCTECKCSLYNVTKDESGYPLRKNYIGGLNCCYDKTQCQLREGFGGGEIRKLYLRYSVKWTQWNESIIPVKIYILDVTDTGRIPGGASSSCKIEYQVDQCEPQTVHSGKCVDTKKAIVIIPKGGDIVYAVGHQHSGGLGSSVYGQDGRVLCTSMPTYGNGNEAGNEEGYVVGMSTCYPEPGSVKIEDGEFLTIESNYNNSQMHTGVMGLFYIMIAEPQPEPKSVILFHNLSLLWRRELTKCWPALFLVGGVVAIIITISYSRRYNEGYLSL
ncbi:uncharacterized protein LOC109824914 [Asparagus officinalis]|uniref:uncharacterized protein LOC109824914 n=1 Tax=Asparagus officinalis TaxID=4686 RepID=UPI00098E393B|nr:uncharacterized protein LOC109824914 [Asparagus officinalis]